MKAKKTLVGRIHAAVLEFTVGDDPLLDLVLTESDCIGTAAHATMLSRLPARDRVLSAAERKRIVSALVALMKRARRQDFEITFQDQDVHLAVEQSLTNRLGDLGKRIHTGRSRNDQVAVDLRLYGKECLLLVMESALDLAQVLTALGKRHAAVPMVGRTHMQPAMPSSVGLWASAYAEGLLDDLIVVKAAYDVNNRCPLGSAAGYGVSLGIDRDLTSRLLGFQAPIHNVLCAANARGKCESVILSALAQVMMTLSRLAEDLIIYSMPEFGYFSVPAEFCTGSSIMPQKRNPDVLELVRSRAKRLVGDAATVAGMVTGLPGGYNRDLQETKGLFLGGIQTGFSCLEIMVMLMETVQVHKDALADGFTPEVFAADRALELVGKGMPFRDAYRKVKSELADLADRDLAESLAGKTHVGAPAGVDFSLLRGRGGEMKKFVNKEKRAYYSAITKLLGVSYPRLK